MVKFNLTDIIIWYYCLLDCVTFRVFLNTCIKSISRPFLRNKYCMKVEDFMSGEKCNLIETFTQLALAKRHGSQTDRLSR